MNSINILVAIILCYLIGGIPFSYILCKIIKDVDLSKVGSKNIGATNAARVLGKKWFFIITILDMLKGFVPSLIFKNYFKSQPEYLIFIIIALILGHSYSIYLKFKGGKGVAVTAGIFLAVDFRIVILGTTIFILVLLITKYVSLSSILASISLPVSYYFLNKEKDLNIYFLILTIFISSYIIFKHKANIKRIIRGEEYKWGRKI